MCLKPLQSTQIRRKQEFFVPKKQFKIELKAWENRDSKKMRG